MKFLCSEKISSHKYKTPEGYLVCVDSVLARTGKQTYKRSEIFGCDCKDAENEVDVDRPAEEVFSDKTLASFENKPLTIEHPDEDVNTSNHRDLAVGFARDIKRGKDNGQDVMLGTLVFTDADAIEAIESGDMVELSCGYDADIVDEDNPCQRNIRGNHIALCQRGRAGNARIVDSNIVDMAKLSADESSTLKAMIEGGAGKRLYERLSYDKPATIHLTQEDKELLRWHRDENQYLTNEEKTLLKKLVGDSKVRDDSLQKGKTYVAKSGATLKVVDYECSFSDYNGEATIIITYDYVSASGKKSGRAKANAHDFWKMLTDKSLTGDSVKDNLELPEDEDSTFLYRDAYGKEIIVTNWDGGSVFLVEYDGTEQQMNKRDVEYYLDRKGARFSRVLRDSVKDEKWYDPEYSKYVTEDYIKKQYENFKKSPYFTQTYEKFREENFIKVEPGMERYYDSTNDSKIVEVENGKKLVQVGKAGAHYAIENHGLWWIMHKGKTISRHETKEDARRVLEEYSMRDNMKDADFSKQSKQGYQVIEMYRDAGRLHAILKRANDYVIAYGYDSSDGTWAQGRYDFSTLDKARQALQEEKKYAKRISDVDTYEEATKGLKKQAKKEMSDSKEDILAKIRTTQLREGDTFEMRDGQYLVQIQNVGKQTIEFKGNNWRVGHASIKESSWAWGRIWKNGTIVFNETDALNIVRDKMIQFMKSVRDSKRR